MKDQKQSQRQDPYAEANAGKIEPVSFRITYTENPRQGWPEVATWQEIDEQLYEIHLSIRQRGGFCDKTDVQITFADGHTYTAKADPNKHKPETLKKHVRRYVGGMAGIIKPELLTAEDWAGHQKAYGKIAGAFFYFFARDYAVGVPTPEDHIGRLNRAGKGRGARVVKPSPVCTGEAWPGKVLRVDMDEHADGKHYPVLVVEYDNGEREAVYPSSVDAAPAPYEVWSIGPNAASPGEILHESTNRTEAHNVRRELAEEYAGSADQVEVWRDGQPDPDPSAEPEEIRLTLTDSGRRLVESLQAEVDEREGRTHDPLLAADVLAFLQFVEEATPNGTIQDEAQELAERVRKGRL